MTTQEVNDAIAAGFATESYDTPEKITAFVQTSVRQMKLIVQQNELQRIMQAQSDAIAANTVLREAKQAEIVASQGQLLALISAQ